MTPGLRGRARRRTNRGLAVPEQPTEVVRDPSSRAAPIPSLAKQENLQPRTAGDEGDSAARSGDRPESSSASGSQWDGKTSPFLSRFARPARAGTGLETWKTDVLRETTDDQ